VLLFTAMMSTLPTGQKGRALAIGITLVVLLLAWFAVVQPLRDWYEDRAEKLAQRHAILVRMAALAEQIPALRLQAAALGGNEPTQSSELAGDTDAIAGAGLEEAVEALAAGAGVTLASKENLPAVPNGHYHRIGLRLSLVAPYKLLVRLLQAVSQATPRMLVDDVHIEGAHLVNQPVDAPLEAQFTIVGFRRAEP
jgi:general secretion pathway protein M